MDFVAFKVVLRRTRGRAKVTVKGIVFYVFIICLWHNIKAATCMPENSVAVMRK